MIFNICFHLCVELQKPTNFSLPCIAICPSSLSFSYFPSLFCVISTNTSITCFIYNTTSVKINKKLSENKKKINSNSEKNQWNAQTISSTGPVLPLKLLTTLPFIIFPDIENDEWNEVEDEREGADVFVTKIPPLLTDFFTMREEEEAEGGREEGEEALCLEEGAVVGW